MLCVLINCKKAKHMASLTIHQDLANVGLVLQDADTLQHSIRMCDNITASQPHADWAYTPRRWRTRNSADMSTATQPMGRDSGVALLDIHDVLRT